MARKAAKRRTGGAGHREMLVDERRQLLLERIRVDGRVLVGEISEELKISQITIRKDLDYLHSKGMILRSHGGALRLPSQPGALLDPTVQEKSGLHSEEKRKIAARALSMVEERQCIILDSGTTTMAIAQGLKRFAELTVVTNAVNIAVELAATELEVILVGGTLRRNSFSLVGPFAEDNLKEIHADTLFLGVDGFDTEAGVTTPNFLESRVNRVMMKSAQRVVAVCDSSKFQRRTLCRIAPPNEVHTLITDSKLPAEAAAALRSQGVEVILV